MPSDPLFVLVVLAVLAVVVILMLGIGGFAKGGANVRLEPLEDGGTRLIYDVEAKVGGKLAQLGSRLIDGFAKKMADQFFTRFQEVLEGPAESAEGDDAAPEAEKKGWIV